MRNNERNERKMKRLSPAVLLAASWMAAGAAVTTWPQTPSASATESVRNHRISLDPSKLQEVAFNLEAPDCVASEVIVAVGHDTDEDGDLSMGETAFFIGNDCGERYTVDCASGETRQGIGTVKIKARDINPAWDTVKIIKRGTAALNESVSMTTENKMFVIRIR